MQTPKSLGITPTQFKNLAKLTIFVRDKVAPPKFNINKFFIGKGVAESNGDNSGDYCPSAKDYTCGTSACFLGYGPLAGIKPQKDAIWWDYSAKSFGVTMSEMDHDLYDLLFNDMHKNSKSAAVKRGAWFLMNGIPDYLHLEKWETPRSFKPDWAEIEKIANS